ncbi:MAG: hypothetical protein C3F13_17070 [Anaerolineales bacterium]|nr:hypothetical protein [Anaerolineae bacterium]PWB50179.1 MAG: hypothetical protein C3F13_17070 [Anaerolineales bacterium]
MSFLKSFSNIFSTKPSEAERALYLYVQCNKCGEKLRARVDIYSELSPDYKGSDKPASYYCRKVLVGEKQCYQPIELILKFDKNHKLVNQQISGGKFVTRDEFESLI